MTNVREEVDLRSDRYAEISKTLVITTIPLRCVAVGPEVRLSYRSSEVSSLPPTYLSETE